MIRFTVKAPNGTVSRRKILAGLAAGTAAPWLGAFAQASTTGRTTSRARDLVARMTLDEKVSMVHGTGGFSTTDRPPPTIGNFGYTRAIPRLGIPALVFGGSDGGIGDAGVTPKMLGILTGAGNDGLSPTAGGGKVGQTIPTRVTAFPQAITQAATWDRDSVRAIGRAIASEAKVKGIDVLLAGAASIARSPTAGRTFESFGEDPHLSGHLVAEFIIGTQSVPGIIGQIHRLALDSQETNRGTGDPKHTVSANVDERTMRELYLLPYEIGVTLGRPGSAMSSYNRINGVYASEDRTLLTTALRDEWGFDGFVVSDWGGTHSTVPAATAGLDMEQPDGKFFGKPLAAAVSSGQLPATVLDGMVFRILGAAERFGVLDKRKASAAELEATQASTPAHRALARAVAADGAVLLRNIDGLLPLGKSLRNIAIIGAAADSDAIYEYQGAGSGHVPFENFTDLLVTPRDAITRRAARQGTSVHFDDGLDLARAARVAAAADVALVFVHDPQSEGFDRRGLEMQGGSSSFFRGISPAQLKPNTLIAAVTKANPKTVVVIAAGGPVAMPWLEDVGAVLDLFYPGQQFGEVASDLLFGDVNPSGKLPVSFPKRAADAAAPPLPADQIEARYSEGLQVGYRWHDAHGVEPLFPFGFGLSYETVYEYSALGLSSKSIPIIGTPVLDREALKLRFNVANRGKRAGKEVAQVYLRLPASVKGEPPKRLAAFAKKGVAAGASTTFMLTLDERAFAFWNTDEKRWAVAPGEYLVQVGTSSSDIKLEAKLLIGA